MKAKIPMDSPTFAVDLLRFPQEDILFNKKKKSVARFIILSICSLHRWQQVPKVKIPQAVPSHSANLVVFLKKKAKHLLEEKRGGRQGERSKHQVGLSVGVVLVIKCHDRGSSWKSLSGMGC